MNADPDSSRRVALSANPAGHFVAEATINGGRVAVMVDTGATVVALTDATARRLGIYPVQSAFTERMTTANGVVSRRPRHPARGPPRQRRAPRRRRRSSSPAARSPVDLLGMSFLGRLSKFEIASGQLVLSQ